MFSDLRVQGQHLLFTLVLRMNFKMRLVSMMDNKKTLQKSGIFMGG